jgi:hypothetical protein
MRVKLQYSGPSTKGRSHVYKLADYGNITVIVYAPKTDTVRPPLELEVPDWWINNVQVPESEA